MKEQVFDWSSLIGYKKDLEQIKSLIKEKTLPSVMLFHGREGIGKSLFVKKIFVIKINHGTTFFQKLQVILG